MKSSKSIPAAWKPVIALATRQLEAKRFMAVLETLGPLGEAGMAHKGVSELHYAALAGFGKEALKARKRRSPEQRARERDEARAKATIERETKVRELRDIRAVAETECERAVARARTAYETFCDRVARGLVGDSCFCTIETGGRVFKVLYRHPRDMGPGPFRSWKAVSFMMAPIGPGNSLGDWETVAPRGLYGDPTSRAGGATAVEQVVRQIFSMQGATRVTPRKRARE